MASIGPPLFWPVDLMLDQPNHDACELSGGSTLNTCAGMASIGPPLFWPIGLMLHQPNYDVLVCELSGVGTLTMFVGLATIGPPLFRYTFPWFT